MESNIHVYAPKIIKTSIRLLPKYKHFFLDQTFKTIIEAFNYGIENYKEGFRIYRQNCYEWYEPDNFLLIKVNNITKESPKFWEIN